MLAWLGNRNYAGNSPVRVRLHTPCEDATHAARIALQSCIQFRATGRPIPYPKLLKGNDLQVDSRGGRSRPLRRENRCIFQSDRENSIPLATCRLSFKPEVLGRSLVIAIGHLPTYSRHPVGPALAPSFSIHWNPGLTAEHALSAGAPFAPSYFLS
jgi:hypothetical protein